MCYAVICFIPGIIHPDSSQTSSIITKFVFVSEYICVSVCVMIHTVIPILGPAGEEDDRRCQSAKELHRLPDTTAL